MGELIRRGDVWWTQVAEPSGSEPGFDRPVVVVQSDAFTESGTRTVVVVPLTSNLAHADRPGTVVLSATATGLPRDSVARADQVFTADRRQFRARAGRLAPSALEQLYFALDVALGR
jgi:mRNA interferase MazF